MIEWWGWREDMAAVYAAAHIVCLPSYREGLPTVLLEAGACGCALVTTDVPGCREVVRDGETGLVVPSRDPMALAQAFRTRHFGFCAPRAAERRGARLSSRPNSPLNR